MLNLFKWVVHLTGMTNMPPLMAKFTISALSHRGSRYASLKLSCLALLVMMPCVTSAASLNNGQQLYMTHCAGCHGMNGISVIPQAKDFSRANLLAQPDQSLIDLVRSGRDMMPAYFGILNDSEILDVINYLRILN